MRLDLVPLTFAIALTALPLNGREVPREARHSAEPKPLPLALDDSFRIRKVSSLQLDPIVQAAATARGGISNSYLQAEIDRRYYGAVSNLERRMREGHYYNFEWSTSKTLDLRICLEFRVVKVCIALFLFVLY
jgi:hypothetical protein